MITTEYITQKLAEAEANGKNARNAAIHWEARAEQLRELIAEADRPADQKPGA